jgi:hypothetical protein
VKNFHASNADENCNKSNFLFHGKNIAPTKPHIGPHVVPLANDIEEILADLNYCICEY